MSETQYFCTSWGQTTNGQLGTSQRSRDAYVPHQATLVSPPETRSTFVDITCGESHSLMLTNNFQLLACGSNTYG